VVLDVRPPVVAHVRVHAALREHVATPDAVSSAPAGVAHVAVPHLLEGDGPGTPRTTSSTSEAAADSPAGPGGVRPPGRVLLSPR
jgi:hypothetical protein